MDYKEVIETLEDLQTLYKMNTAPYDALDIAIITLKHEMFEVHEMVNKILERDKYDGYR